MADLLTATLPTVWQGRRIDPDFRHMVRLSSAYAHGELDGDHPETALAIMAQFYREPVLQEQSVAAYSSMIDFYRAGEQALGGSDDGPSEPAASPAFDYRCDAPYIVAAFQRLYGIDLTRERIHWFRFRALLRGAIGEDCMFSRIIDWRTADLAEMDPEKRRFYEEKREHFALPPELRGGAARVVSVEEHDAAFLARFRR